MKSLIESILADIDSSMACGDLINILDKPTFNKNDYNKLYKLLKNAGGEDFDENKHKNDDTYFIVFETSGLNKAKTIYIGTNMTKVTKHTNTPMFSRVYYNYHYEYNNNYQPEPSKWIETNLSATHYFSKGANGRSNYTKPISIPAKYLSFISYLKQVAEKEYCIV